MPQISKGRKYILIRDDGETELKGVKYERDDCIQNKPKRLFQI